jgi:hypothetical protein
LKSGLPEQNETTIINSVVGARVCLRVAISFGF